MASREQGVGAEATSASADEGGNADGLAYIDGATPAAWFALAAADASSLLIAS